MIMAIPLVGGHRAAGRPWEATGELLFELSSPTPREDPLEELIEMRYQQHLAQRALQELFEEGALQGLEM
jgi:hypothetical protein